MTGRAGPRIGYLNSLAARTAGESLRPPHRLFGPVFAEPPTAEAPDRADQPSRAAAPGRRQAADIGPGDPGHRGPGRAASRHPHSAHLIAPAVRRRLRPGGQTSAPCCPLAQRRPVQVLPRRAGTSPVHPRTGHPGQLDSPSARRRPSDRSRRDISSTPPRCRTVQGRCRMPLRRCRTALPPTDVPPPAPGR